MSFVVEQPPAVDRRHEDVVAAVVVVVRDRGSKSVDAGRVEAAASEDICERPVAVVAKQSVAGPAPARRPVLAVDEEQVRPVVAVDVEDGHAAAEKLRVPVVAGGAVPMNEINPGAAGDIGENDRLRLRLRLRLRGAERGERAECDGGGAPDREETPAAIRMIGGHRWRPFSYTRR